MQTTTEEVPGGKPQEVKWGDIQQTRELKKIIVRVCQAIDAAESESEPNEPAPATEAENALF